jgi:two-component sensor histidine kinase
MNTQTIGTIGIRPKDLVATRAELPRPVRKPDFRAEMAGTSALSTAVLTSPGAAIPQVLTLAIRLCRAGSAGISLLKRDSAAGPILRWEQVSGELQDAVGLETPRTANPCGLCLDSGATVMVRLPERAFPGLKSIRPAIVEQLIVPLRDWIRRPIGTLWIASHDPNASLSFEDARILEHLAAHVTLALQLVQQTEEHLLVLEQYQRLTRELIEEHDLRCRAEASQSDLNRKLSAAHVAIRETNHRVKNTLAAAIGLLSLQRRAATDTDVLDCLHASRSRLEALAKVHELLAESVDAARAVHMPSLLRLIADAFQESFSTSHANVRVLINADDMTLGADEAMPLASFVNEALTNAHKHAFAANAAGTIAVHLSRTAEAGILLRVMDDGIGLPDTLREGGLGLSLMQSLANQLAGVLTFTRPNDTSGTIITLRIDRTSRHAAAQPGIAGTRTPVDSARDAPQ